MPFATLAMFLIVFVFASWVAYALPGLRRQWKQVDSGGPSPDVMRLQEVIDDLSQRVQLLEEERDFFKELRAPDTPHEIGPTPGRGSPPSSDTGSE